MVGAVTAAVVDIGFVIVVGVGGLGELAPTVVEEGSGLVVGVGLGSKRARRAIGHIGGVVGEGGHAGRVGVVVDIGSRDGGRTGRPCQAR